jgi:HSP20 family protein
MATRIIRRTVAPLSPVASEALSLRDMMNRLMENAFVSPEQWFNDTPLQGYAPAIDVAEDSNAYTIKAALPGWKPENVGITFENGVLTLKGEVNEETNGEEKGDENETTRWHRREIRRSSFVRSVALPTEVEADKAQAEFENGVLTLKLPKAEVIKPRQIKINAK